MNKHAKIYIAGHRGLVGSALVRNLTAAGFTIAAHAGGGLLQILALCWLAAVTTALALIDAAVKRLPDRLTVPAFAGTSVLLTAAALQQGRPGSALRMLLAAAVLGAVYFIFALAGAMGPGDVKLALALGAALGYSSWTHVVRPKRTAFPCPR